MGPREFEKSNSNSSLQCATTASRSARLIASSTRRATSTFSRIERFVALPHGLLEADLGGTLLERVALLRVARDAVHERAERLRRVQPLRVEGLVHQQLHHHELIHGHLPDPPDECLEGLVQLGCRGCLDREAPLLRLY